MPALNGVTSIFFTTNNIQSLTRVDAGPGSDHHHVAVRGRWDEPVLQERPLKLHRRIVGVLGWMQFIIIQRKT